MASEVSLEIIIYLLGGIIVVLYAYSEILFLKAILLFDDFEIKNSAILVMVSTLIFGGAGALCAVIILNSTISGNFLWIGVLILLLIGGIIMASGTRKFYNAISRRQEFEY